MQTAIVFIIYVLFFNWLVTRISFIKKTDVPVTWITFLFSLKIIAGLLYAWFYMQPAYYSMSDTWRYFELSKGETDWLLRDPWAFFKDIFVSGYSEQSNLFSGYNSYWNDLKSNVIIKLLAICNVCTFKNYYADIVLFNFLFFFGPVAFYKLIRETFNIHRSLLVAVVFLIPSFLFWCSGVHKDGLIFSALAMCIYYFHRLLTLRKWNARYIVIMILCLILIFALRNFLVFLLIPALLSWALSCLYFKKRKFAVFVIVYACCLMLFCISGSFSSSFNLPLYFIEKQNEFKNLQGQQIDLPNLQLTFSSFLYFTPYAFDNVFLQPHITYIKNFSYLPAALENIFIAVLILFCFIVRKKNIDFSPFLLFCIFFSVSVLIVAGYTITSPAAIVRYKSVVLPLLVIPFILNAKPGFLKKFRDKFV